MVVVSHNRSLDTNVRVLGEEAVKQAKTSIKHPNIQIKNKH